MRLTPAELSGDVSNGTWNQGRHHPPLQVWLLAGLVLGWGMVGCGPADAPPGSGEGVREAAPVLAEGRMEEVNGLSTNGLSTNGLSTNGLSTNGLSTNGLSTNGFSTWFEAGPANADVLMRYVVRCAVAAGQTRTYNSPTGATYTWEGNLGLLPSWASGQPATEAEQQLLTACLAAHTNKFGISIGISVLGRDATGTAIPYTQGELATYSEKEACFFGNLFTNEGIFAANDRAYLSASESTSRACGLSSTATSTLCSPIVHVGACADFCTRGGDSTRPYYTACTYNGKTYRPLTTRIEPEEIFSCGDGTCQFTEHCGTGTTFDSCRADCGACPG